MQRIERGVSSILLPLEVTVTSQLDFEQELVAALAEKPALVQIDCNHLDRVTSGHVNLLWHANSACDSYRVKLCLRNPSKTLMRILKMMDLADLFAIQGAPILTDTTVEEPAPAIAKPLSYSDSVGPTVADIDRAISRFVGFLTELGVGPVRLLELRTIYYEIATNIRIHSGVSSADSIHIQVVADPDKLTLTFTDTGKPFDPTGGRNKFDAIAASQHRQKRGFGLPMIHQFADSITYHRDESACNTLTLSKKWRC